ncbi:MauE/DoxX family redox-associated membrane protein [Pseudalkalibacillus hwajinpoensis]|uniref:DoxX family membrane protein n=1 Tax=Guptibacillus hwajinpoensis TaxID=208199 RepID=A0A4U1MNG7_9BACL|nr:MauE/DoxX family redox-associated membrane protein [Pseudalkalibacillus hwajinpoensis]TKD72286.1 DoxX family membrane protein [Pseudalkalibacillus hwajinpoensis]
MVELTLLLQLVLGLIFLSSAIEKLVNFTKHVVAVKSYEILPDRFARPFSRVEVAIELVSSLLLIIGMFPWISITFLVFLLVLYSYAMVFNLLKGRKEFNCGCGGIMGDHRLSWLLVLRNLIMVLILMYIYNYSTAQMVTSNFTVADIMQFFLIAGCIVLVMGTLPVLKSIRKLTNNIIKEGSKLKSS